MDFQPQPTEHGVQKIAKKKIRQSRKKIEKTVKNGENVPGQKKMRNERVTNEKNDGSNKCFFFFVFHRK